MLLQRSHRHPSLRTRRKRFAGHLGFVKGFRCLIADQHDCQGLVDPHHLQDGFDDTIPDSEWPGIGKKAHDKWTVPLCRWAHIEIHSVGHAAFEQKHNVDLMAGARELQRRSPFRRQWE